MKYSKKYSKLDWDAYTTIRRYPKGKPGTIVIENYPGGWHYAKIVKVERKTFAQIDLELLKKDTDTDTRKEAFELLQSFYKKPIDPYKDKLYVYHLKKMKGG